MAIQPGVDRLSWRAAAALDAGWLTEAAKAAGPPLLFGLRLWASVCLALYVAFWLELDNAYWAGTSAAIVCQPQLGASPRKGWFRLGTLVGAVEIVVLTACFPQDRGAFLIGLALWGAGCALVATLLRNFASYAATLAGRAVSAAFGKAFMSHGSGEPQLHFAERKPERHRRRRDQHQKASCRARNDACAGSG